MSEKEKARRDFWDEYGLDKRSPSEASAMCFGWMIGFDRGREPASQNARKDEPEDGNVRFVLKSEGAATDRFIAKEDQVYSFSSEDGEKNRKDDDFAEFAFGVAIIALVVGVAALITVMVHVSPGV